MMEKARCGFWHFVGLVVLVLLDPTSDLSDEHYAWYLTFAERHRLRTLR